MSTVELSAPVGNDLVDLLECHFCELSESPWSLFQIRCGEPFTLHGYFADEAEGRLAWQGLVEAFPRLCDQPRVNAVEDKDWQNAYKEYLQPWHSRGLHWVPVWMRDSYHVPTADVAVYFDAGMAFGTGSHETTQLCAGRLLDLRQGSGLGRKMVVDAGCGSGILAISAALLGAHRVLGFDIDPAAVAVSLENHAKAALSDDCIAFTHADLSAGLKGIKADFIMANIQSDILIANAALFPPAMANQSLLALSGILGHEMDAVRQEFCSLPNSPLRFIDSRSQGEWCDILFEKP